MQVSIGRPPVLNQLPLAQLRNDKQDIGMEISVEMVMETVFTENYIHIASLFRYLQLQKLTGPHFTSIQMSAKVISTGLFIPVF